MNNTYKNTEIGYIPNDWEINFIRNLAIINTGNKNTQDKSENGLYPFFVRSQIVEQIDSYSFDGEAVLTAGDGVGVGKVIHYINGKFDYHQRVYKISNFFEKLNGHFFYLYFNANFLNRIMQMTAKSSVDSIRMDMIANMKIPIPPLHEQILISEILSDTDQLIENLEELIQKKKMLKQATMHTLLTPKKHWEVKKLGEFLGYEQPTEYIVIDTEYNDNNLIPVLTAGKTFILGYTDEEFGIFRKLPVIIFDDFTTAIKFVNFPFKVKSSAMKILHPRHNNVNLRFIYECMLNIKYPLGDHKRHWIGEYQNITIPIPPISEQLTISTILSDMDTEIEALTTKYEKYKQIKQGLMHELLTGKTRLL